MQLNDLIRQQQENTQKKTEIRIDNLRNQKFTEFWNSNCHEEWLRQEQVIYQNKVSFDNKELDKSFDILDYNDVANLTVDEFYDFLYHCYFVWKFTAKNRLSTTRTNLKRHKDNLQELSNIQKELFLFDRNDIVKGLEIASRIHGLGYAGASGLLAILYPKYFGTVDQFVVRSLLQIENFDDRNIILAMNPNSLRKKDAVSLILIMRKKAEELNTINRTDYWTPRKVDKVLWSYR